MADHAGSEGLCLSPLSPQTRLFLSAGEYRPGCLVVVAAGLEEVARTSGAVQGTAVAASDKRRLWKE